jgi:hypothetical protein
MINARPPSVLFGELKVNPIIINMIGIFFVSERVNFHILDSDAPENFIIFNDIHLLPGLFRLPEISKIIRKKIIPSEATDQVSIFANVELVILSSKNISLFHASIPILACIMMPITKYTTNPNIKPNPRSAL